MLSRCFLLLLVLSLALPVAAQMPNMPPPPVTAPPADEATSPLLPRFEIPAREVLLLDMSSGAVLFARNADERMPTSSMSKVMTMLLVFEALRDGRLTRETLVPISERAWAMQGSKTFVPVGGKVRAEDLIRGVIVQSGNDASVALAEMLAGTEEAFAQQMNVRAQAIGMTNSQFRNATGWPDPEHYATARDLARLAEYLITNFPEEYSYYAEREFTFNDITQQNRNPVLGRVPGADGIKTGHTEAAGFGLIASAVRDGRRLLLVINGLPSMAVRADISAAMLEWGFRNFTQQTLFAAGQEVDRARIWLGTQATVSMQVARPVSVVYPVTQREIELKVVLNEPVAAPVRKGQEIGKLLVADPVQGVREYPLQAGADVAQLGPVGRVLAMIRHWLGER